MRIITRAIALFVFYFLFSSCPAQIIKFKRYTTGDGLLSDEVYNLHQDKKGYLWLFTNYGALKYNGTSFKPVLKNLPFNESFIYSMYENEAGKMWVSSSKSRIYEVINDSAFIVKGTEETSGLLQKDVVEILQLHVDDSLNIYALTKHISFKFVNEQGKYRSVPLIGGQNDSTTYHIYEKNNKIFRALNFTGNDTVFCGGRDHLNIQMHLRNKTSFFRLPCNHTDPRFFKRFGRNIYFSHHTNLNKYDEQGHITTMSFNSLILNFTKDRNGHLWVACLNNGLFELNERDSVINHYFEKITINDVLADSQGGLWASSVGSGLFHCPDLNDFEFDENTPLGRPISFLRILEGKLYIGNAMGDVYSVKHNLFSLFKQHTIEDEPKDMFKDGERYIIPSMYSIAQSGYYKEPQERKVVPISAVKIMPKGKDTMIFLLRKRVLLLVNGTFKNSISLNYKAFSLLIRKNKILIAMENGLWHLENTVLVQPDFLKGTKHLKCKALTKDSLDNFWICTEGEGLYKLTPDDNLVNYTVQNGLPGNILNDIQFSRDGVLLSTNTGLYYTRSIQDEMSWTSVYSGLVNSSVFFEDRIYLNTRNGLIIINKKKITGNKQPHFNLSEINVNTLPVNPETLNALNYNQNNLEFNFDVISFNDEKYKLYYKLQGEASDSGTVDSYIIGFQKLPPGNYTLTVYPLVENGALLKLEFPFYIIPAFWQTNTFIFLIVSVFILIAVFITVLIFRYLRKKELRKNKAERLIQEYKLIALKAQINPHFMSNCLTAVQNLIINNKVDMAADYIAKFGMLVRQILNFSTRSLVTVQEELEITALNIELEQLRFENKFLFELTIAEDVNIKSIFIPALILNPIIENAIWHGLLPLKRRRQGRLLIEVKLVGDTLQLSIEDNGVGRNQSLQHMSNSRESKGIALTEQRLSNINYMFNIKNSQLVYEDLQNELTQERGTRVTISLPVNLKPLQNE